MVQLAGDRLSVMAGAGVNASNAAEIVALTGIKEIHLSGKTTRSSYMTLPANQVSMGLMDDFTLGITGEDNILAVRRALNLS